MIFHCHVWLPEGNPIYNWWCGLCERIIPHSGGCVNHHVHVPENVQNIVFLVASTRHLQRSRSNSMFVAKAMTYNDQVMIYFDNLMAQYPQVSNQLFNSSGREVCWTNDKAVPRYLQLRHLCPWPKRCKKWSRSGTCCWFGAKMALLTLTVALDVG